MDQKSVYSIRNNDQSTTILRKLPPETRIGVRFKQMLAWMWTLASALHCPNQSKRWIDWTTITINQLRKVEFNRIGVDTKIVSSSDWQTGNETTSNTGKHRAWDQSKWTTEREWRREMYLHLNWLEWQAARRQDTIFPRTHRKCVHQSNEIRMAMDNNHRNNIRCVMQLLNLNELWM